MKPDNRITETVKACIADITHSLDDYIGLIAEWVNMDSGEDHPDGIYVVQRQLVKHLSGEGMRVVWKKTDKGISHFRATIPGSRKRIVLLGHTDTVLEMGTASKRPFKLEGENAYGPGVVDMKGGLVMTLAAVNWLIKNNIPCQTIDFVVVGDEETRTAPPPFLDDLTGSSACLVLECGRPGGGFVVSRKGGLWIMVAATGHSSHAGTEPEKGRNAILSLCREVLRISELALPFAVKQPLQDSQSFLPTPLFFPARRPALC